MSLAFTRADQSIASRWWWTVDRWLLGACLALVAVGILLSFAASPSVADRLHLGSFHFVKRHVVMLLPSMIILGSVSLMSPVRIRRFAFVAFPVLILLLILTPIIGTEVKGARRWISILGVTLQISEFLKPVFVIVTAWVLALRLREPTFPSLLIATGLYTGVATLLLVQPDLGMTVLVTAIWAGQLFLAGIPMVWVWVMAGAGVVGLAGAYSFFPHVAKRLDHFLNPGTGDVQNELYQVHQSMEAFHRGGLFGTGPGEGVIKRYIPDVHADFVYAVLGEEFGLIVSLLVLATFAFIVLRTMAKAFSEDHPFTMLALFGLASQFALQTIINIGSTVNLLPTKGMTLPFVSHGGSSLMATALGMGMILALTRKRYGG